MHNNNKELTLSAPLSGPVLTLAKVPDPVFASGAMGDGIAIDPLNDTLHAPCAGVVVHVARTGHAVTLRADNGAELLLHLGLDTVALQGEGFSMLVKEGARVSNGQPLLRYDLDKVAQQCKSLVSLMILTNSQDFQARPITLKSVKVGEPLLHIIRRHASGAQTEAELCGEAIHGHIRIAHRGGLHARPAALIRQTAQGFKSQSQLHFAGLRQLDRDDGFGRRRAGRGSGQLPGPGRRSRVASIADRLIHSAGRRQPRRRADTDGPTYSSGRSGRAARCLCRSRPGGRAVVPLERHQPAGGCRQP